MKTSRFPWMSRFLNLSAPAILLASAFGADNLLSEAEMPVPQGPDVSQAALPRHGFTIQYLRREVADPAMRLWLCGDPGPGYAQVASQRIHSLAPPAPATAPDITLSGELPVQDPFQKLIASAASRYQIDPDFVASVVKAESGFNPTAVSPKGAQGLMQLMPDTAATLGVEDLLDPATNLVAGSKYLRQLLDQFAGDSAKALAAYIAGPQRVEQYGGIPPSPQTRAYVSRIIDDYNRKKFQQQPNLQPEPAGN